MISINLESNKTGEL